MSNLSFASLSRNNSSDVMGALASGLCMIHCLFTPLLFLIPAIGFSEPSWWGAIDYIFLIISVVAVYFSAKHSSLRWMKIALYASWAALALFILNEKFHLFHLDHLFILVPTLSLIGLHLYNRKYCRCDDEECCEPL